MSKKEFKFRVDHEGNTGEKVVLEGTKMLVRYFKEKSIDPYEAISIASSAIVFTLERMASRKLLTEHELDMFLKNINLSLISGVQSALKFKGESSDET